MESFVVIDLGSNSIRMKITQILHGNYLKVTGQYKDYVRLSENMGPERTLKPVPIERTMNALRRFKSIYDKLPRAHVRAIATAAVRQAQNQADFLKLVKDELDLDFDVISGKEEAYLDYLGVVRTLPIGDCLIMDTGGASTELILVKDGKVENLISLPFGAVTISQTYNLGDAIPALNLFDAMTFTEQHLTSVAWLSKAHKLPLVCLGGSNRSLAKIMRRRQDCDPDDLPDINGFMMTAEDVFSITRDMISRNKSGRSNIPGLTKSRADVIVGGLIPINLVLRTCHINEIVCSSSGLREGALFDYLEQKKQDKKRQPEVDDADTDEDQDD